MAGGQEENQGECLIINIGGRPRHYKTPEEFDDKVDEYYQYCRNNPIEPLTWTGLALFLGFSSRQSIDEYLKYDGFSDSVKRAKTLIEYGYEKRLHGNSPTGAIFALKNFSWKDKSEEDQESESPSLNITFSVKEPAAEITVTNAKS